MNKIKFLKHCFKSIRTTGTIARSSKNLCIKMVGEIDFSTSMNIVELGAGDGVLTSYILKNMHPNARLLSFEINEEFCNIMRATIQDERLTIIQDSAEHIDNYLKKYKMYQADAILSALPFVVLPKDLTKNILQTSYNSLKSEGVFVQMHYSLALKKMYKRIFKSVTTKFVPINLPPAYVMRMTK